MKLGNHCDPQTHRLVFNAEQHGDNRALTFLKSSVHLRVGEKLEGEVTWPWQTGQHFTQTLMQHGTRTSPHTAEERKEGEREERGGERKRERGGEVSSQT